MSMWDDAEKLKGMVVVEVNSYPDSGWIQLILHEQEGPPKQAELSFAPQAMRPVEVTDR